eukprot:CAMPEP_0197824424 /NCGR_PEP_ID=MMETSP1437-20131217/1671_1 /TAXON_ID=49252 ORGANISM="Eucampia antarctica, Strain CCMP1452" /NCGR_SAMPLE_ID=MMETSP1437 /ASSEMBLY_ACC=CAM_ASM_001096 /LENGTH=306 /DNA_ID=CAMNT_0043424043 /DNA_START=60 /DNA_END=980 /DNA_ORIENTATION=-
MRMHHSLASRPNLFVCMVVGLLWRIDGSMGLLVWNDGNNLVVRNNHHNHNHHNNNHQTHNHNHYNSNHHMSFVSCQSKRNNENEEEVNCSSSYGSRRSFLSVTAGIIFVKGDNIAYADDVDVNVDVNVEDEDGYKNPNIPVSPEEKSGLTVLRVAEVAQFQEMILRAVANGEIENVVLSAQQIAFGTRIMMRNSNLDGNMKLMIYNEMPKKNRKYAIQKAVNTMNTLQSIVTQASKIDHPLTKEEMLEMADLYRYARLELNEMYEYLSPNEKDKYYGYLMKVTEYEKKIAEGTYNPELDGILKFDN